MKVRWLKVWKTFRGGMNEGYIMCNKSSDEEDFEAYARDWAEKSSGGHNYGWVVHWKEVDKPSPEWIHREQVKLNSRLRGIKWQLDILEEIK